MEQLRKSEGTLVMEGEDEEEGGGSRGNGGPQLTAQCGLEMQACSLGPSPLQEKPRCPKDDLYLTTRQLLLAFFREYAGPEALRPVKALLGLARPNKALQTLLRVGRDLTGRYHIPFQAMQARLAVQGPQDLHKLTLVSCLVFSDGVTNWGRIATLLTFGAFMAKHLESAHLEGCTAALADVFTEFLMSAKRDWIAEHGGWDGFVEFFQVRDCESGVRMALMAFAGVAGIGASLAYLIR